VISHDRDLLDRAVDSILHLDGGRLTIYRGGYTAFDRQRRERQALDQKLVKKQEAERKRIIAFVDRFRAKASKARQAQSRLKLLAKLEPPPAVVADEVREIAIPDPERLPSPPIVAFDAVAAGYEPGKPVLRRVTLRIDNEDRIALLGANGNGKSTLVKLIAGRLSPSEGRVTRADRLKVAYFAQHQLEELDPAASAYDHVRALMPEAPEAKVRARAGAMGFPGEAADTAVATLSGGEKSRLLLGLACFDAPHVIVLDEPTNHLDIDSRAALIEAINGFAGAVILVSHDRYLLEACADRLMLVANGTVAPFEGDLDDYRAVVLSQARQDDKEAAGRPERARSRAEARRDAAERRTELAPLKRRITGLETEIGKLGRRIGEIDATLADPALYARDPARVATLAKERAAAADALAAAEEQWLALSGEYESAGG
jgi:ATP-binding cassette subfamily F protein 3